MGVEYYYAYYLAFNLEWAYHLLRFDRNIVIRYAALCMHCKLESTLGGIIRTSTILMNKEKWGKVCCRKEKIWKIPDSRRLPRLMAECRRLFRCCCCWSVWRTGDSGLRPSLSRVIISSDQLELAHYKLAMRILIDAAVLLATRWPEISINRPIGWNRISDEDFGGILR